MFVFEQKKCIIGFVERSSLQGIVFSFSIYNGHAIALNAFEANYFVSSFLRIFFSLNSDSPTKMKQFPCAINEM